MGFEADRCQNCGKCLELCIYLPVAGEDAVREHVELVEGGPAETIMKYCIGCGACETFCPNDAHPYSLILDRLHERYVEHGLPERARFLMPTMPNNFREYVTERIPKRERDRIGRWSRETPSGEFLYPGCNFITLAYLADSPVFERLKVAGSLELCCGEMYYRVGMYEDVERLGARLKGYYSQFEIDRMVFVCPACQNMFEHIYPEHFGIEFDFEKVSLWRWILEHAGEFDLAPLGIDVAVHDSCHGRMLGEAFQGDVREVLGLCGVNIHESAEGLNLGHCCGIGACTVRLSVVDVAREGLRAIRAARKTRAGELAAYCGGCLLTLSAIELFSPLHIPIHHVLDYVTRSLGARPPVRHRERAAKMAWGLVLNVAPRYFSSKRIRLEEG